LPVIKPAADGHLIDSKGKLVRLKDLTRGRVTVLSFIYTRCSAAYGCPYATNVLGQLHLASEQDQTLTGKMRLVSLSFDPEHDSPQQLASYADAVRDSDSGCEWDFAVPKTQGDLSSILNAYGQAVDRRPNPNDPQGPLFHMLRVFLIDPEGRIRNIYSSGTLDVRLVLADVKTLVLEKRTSVRN
jgi:cytochrome oxidase Cu insertion factor (SCO1/SenC/PrrC family)